MEPTEECFSKHLLNSASRCDETQEAITFVCVQSLTCGPQPLENILVVCQAIQDTVALGNIPIAISKHVASVQSFRLAASVDESTNQRTVTEWLEF